MEDIDDINEYRKRYFRQKRKNTVGLLNMNRRRRDAENKRRPDVRAKGDAHRKARRSYNDLSILRERQRAMYNMAKKRAREAGVPFTITHEDIWIPEKCPVFGVAFAPFACGLAWNSPSMDRIVPELGYTPDNIVIVSHLANRCKSDASPDELRRIADFFDRLASERNLEWKTRVVGAPNGATTTTSA